MVLCYGVDFLSFCSSPSFFLVLFGMFSCFTSLLSNYLAIYSPFLHADFVQARVAVYGRVKCLLSPCDSSVKISMVQHCCVSVPCACVIVCCFHFQVASAGSTRVNKEKRVTSLDEEDQFSFTDVVPGTYKISVLQDSFCWAQQTLNVNVEFIDVENIEFSQSGNHFVMSTPCVSLFLFVDFVFVFALLGCTRLCVASCVQPPRIANSPPAFE